MFTAAVDYVRTAPVKVQLAYTYIPQLSMIVMFLVTFVISFKMQRYTTDGKFVTIDDDSKLGKKHPSLTHLYNWMLYLALGCLVVDVHSLAALVSASYQRAKNPHAVHLIQIARFVFEILCVAILRVVVLQYLIGKLIMFNQSISSFELDFWQSTYPKADRRPSND